MTLLDNDEFFDDIFDVDKEICDFTELQNQYGYDSDLERTNEFRKFCLRLIEISERNINDLNEYISEEEKIFMENENNIMKD